MLQSDRVEIHEIINEIGLTMRIVSAEMAPRCLQLCETRRLAKLMSCFECFCQASDLERGETGEHTDLCDG